MSYEKIEDVSVYVGPSCNFNCSYCDRAYVKNVGVESASYDPALVDFLVDVYEKAEIKPAISFHGGESLVYIKTIKKIVEEVLKRIPVFESKFYIQTNGSLILKNKEFFVEYSKILYVSISYDFIFQSENRTEYDIEETLQFLNDQGVLCQLQFVVPTNKKNVFNIDTYYSIVKLYRKFRIQRLILILLRHIRHKDHFETVIADESIDLKKFFLGFMQFVQMLYVTGIRVSIDGHATKIDKKYYQNHKQLVLAPNGMLVPEYQTIEYDDYDFNVGRWKPFVELTRDVMPAKAQAKIRQACRTCPMTEICGLRYHYAMFKIDPPKPERCKEFYSLNLIAIKHLFKLNEQPTLLHHIGIQND